MNFSHNFLYGQLDLNPVAIEGRDRTVREFCDELAGGDASVRVDAITDHDDGSGQVLVKVLEELDDVFGANGPWNEAEEEAGSATVRRVGRSSDRREVLPTAEAMFEDVGGSCRDHPSLRSTRHTWPGW